MNNIVSDLANEIRICCLCDLHKTRANAVPGIGPSPCNIMVVAEGPGAEEDKTGEPFVGRSGKLLMQWFNSIGLIRGKDYFLTNIVKCRPPNNRDPTFDEMKICGVQWLKKQIDKVNPKLVITVGRIATQYLLNSDSTMGKLRGQKINRGNRVVMPIYHPSYVLRQGGSNIETELDLTQIKKEIDCLNNT